MISNMLLGRQLQLVWGEQNLFFAVFVSASYYIESIIMFEIATDPGGMKYLLVLQCFSVHCVISNILPSSHFLHDEHYLDYIIPYVPMIYPGHATVQVCFFPCFPS